MQIKLHFFISFATIKGLPCLKKNTFVGSAFVINKIEKAPSKFSIVF